MEEWEKYKYPSYEAYIESKAGACPPNESIPALTAAKRMHARVSSYSALPRPQDVEDAGVVIERIHEAADDLGEIMRGERDKDYVLSRREIIECVEAALVALTGGTVKPTIYANPARPTGPDGWGPSTGGTE